MRKNDILYVFVICLSILSCKSTAKVSRNSTSVLPANTLEALEDSLMGAHLGALVAEAETGKVLAEHNSHKYFVPASNTKLLSLYAGLKYLPDTLTGIKYYDAGDTIYAQPTGDPTLLMSEYQNHPVMDWLGRTTKPVVIDASNWKAERYGRGWTWSDYQASYQPERSALPVYGNIMPLRLTVKSTSTVSDGHQVGMATPFLHLGELNLKTVWNIQPDTVLYVFNPSSKNSYIRRMYASNGYEVTYNGKDTVLRTSIPFVTNGIKTGMDILMARLNKPKTLFRIDLHGGKEIFPSGGKEVKSQPLDSMLRPMMHRSDNFYAEQTLLMASNELIGYMSDRDMIDTMMKTDFKDMPDKPVWADGSGLSRYNLQSPANYVWLLDKMRKEYNMERLKDILPTGNDGTLTNYYKELSGKMFAKTGTLSGVVALSGYLYAKSGKLLLFSVLVNNHNTEAAKVRRQVERYLIGVWEAN